MRSPDAIRVVRAWRATQGLVTLLLATVLWPCPGWGASFTQPAAVNYCVSCHGAPLGAGSFGITTLGAAPADILDANFRAFLQGLNATMNVQADASHVSSADLAAIRPYFWQVRHADLQINGNSGVQVSLSRSFTFPTAVYANEVGTEPMTLKITNLRESAVASVALSFTGASPLWFTTTRNTCGAGLAAATAGAFPVLNVASCEIDVNLAPQGGAPGGNPPTSLDVTLTFAGQTPASVTHSIGLSGTSLGPRAPIYAASGFNATTLPPSLSLGAPTDGSQTLCPIISNSGSAPLTFALAAAQGGASADYTGYYELGSLCPVSGLPPLCIAAAGAIGGSVSVPSLQSCTLAIKFNPAKFGFTGGTGARSAQLTITHPPLSGTAETYSLIGNVTSGPQPQIGISTIPGVNIDGQVLPTAFSNQVLHTSSVMWNDFLVSNIGSADGLQVGQVIQTNPAEFTWVDNCVGAPPLTMISGSGPTCRIGLRFTPNALGLRCTTVNVVATLPIIATQSVAVCGLGVPSPVPQLLVAPASIAFGKRAIGAVYRAENVVISNAASATAPLRLGAISLTGSGFALAVSQPSCQNVVLAAGASCSIGIVFTPDASRPDVSYTSNLAIGSNDPNTPSLTVPLSATAVAYAVPALAWQGNPSTLAFPDVVVAGRQSAQPIVAVLTNPDGPGAVTVQAVLLAGPDASSFTVTGCPPLLYQGDLCQVSLRFSPGSGGLKTAQLQVVTSTGVAPPLLGVAGQGTGATSGTLIGSPAALAFDHVRIGASSMPQSLTLSAGGGGAMTVTAIAAAAPFSIVSQSCPPVPFTLSLGSDCRIGIVFTPTVASDTAGTLQIGTETDANALAVGLGGTGQAPADVSNGGCSLTRGDSLVDPTLWALVMLAAAIASARRRRSGNQPTRREP